jgi:ADP-ribose pyrophosphatase YjhB (NUDIX family)
MEWIKRIRAAIGPELTFVTSAGAWISDDEGRVLLQRRFAADPLWGFPGGIMEIGEAAHETAVREVQEETDLEVEPVSLIGVYTKYFETMPNGDQCQCVSFMYGMRIVGGALHCDAAESFELTFFPPEAMPTLHTEMHRQIAADVLSGRGPFFR